MRSDSSANDAPWQLLFTHAIDLIKHGSRVIGDEIEWTFGGGTVLMLQFHHRRSKDIEIFLSSPQALGLFNPRLSDEALALTREHDESAGYVKLFLPEGEIDFVVAAPLTTDPFQPAHVLDHEVLLERPAEIIAKKFWHRGHIATARDLFDLATVAEREPHAIETAQTYLARNASTFLQQIDQRRAILAAEFDAIDRLDFQLDYDECVAIATTILRPLVN